MSKNVSGDCFEYFVKAKEDFDKSAESLDNPCLDNENVF